MLLRNQDSVVVTSRDRNGFVRFGDVIEQAIEVGARLCGRLCLTPNARRLELRLMHQVSTDP